MEVQQDFKELLQFFNAHKVEYVIIGGYALAFHGVLRNTGDIDILIKSDQDNAQKIMDALDAFGFGDVGISSSDFLLPEKVIQLGVPPVRVDITTSITGVNWEHIAANKVSGTYDDVPVFYISKQDFIANKKALGRHQDLADIEALGEESD